MKNTHYSTFWYKSFEYSCQTLFHLRVVIWVVEVTHFVLDLMLTSLPLNHMDAANVDLFPIPKIF